MKKVLLAFAVASVFAACDSSKTESTESDSTNVKVDSSAITPAVPDTTITTVDSSANKMSADTTKK